MIRIVVTRHIGLRMNSAFWYVESTWKIVRDNLENISPTLTFALNKVKLLKTVKAASLTMEEMMPPNVVYRRSVVRNGQDLDGLFERYSDLWSNYIVKDDRLWLDTAPERFINNRLKLFKLKIKILKCLRNICNLL